jgi:hypothetical protein
MPVRNWRANAQALLPPAAPALLAALLVALALVVVPKQGVLQAPLARRAGLLVGAQARVERCADRLLLQRLGRGAWGERAGLNGCRLWWAGSPACWTRPQCCTGDPPGPPAL